MPPRSKSVSESTFRKGMDCRPGVQGEKLDTFRELTNMVIAEDGTLQTRDACRKMTGQLSASAQGLILNGGQYYTIARRGDSVTHTGDIAAFVQTIYFDPPENVSATWTLVAYEVFQNIVVAYIRHDFPGTTITTRLYQHVWDSLTNHPTYIADPSGTWDWGPAGFPINAYGSGTGTSGNWQDFTPIMEPAAEKLWVNRVDRNVAFGGIARARIWNSLSAENIEKFGAMYYFTVPNIGLVQYAIPEAFADFSDYQKFAGYVLEKLNTNGSWTKITEVFTAPAADQWQIISVTRAWSGVAIAAISANGLTADTLIRIRILAQPEVEIVSGGTITPGAETYRGDGASVQWPSTIPFAAFTSYSVRVNSVVKTITDYYTVANSQGIARVDFRDFAQVTDGKITANVLTAGSGYTGFPAITLVGGTGGNGASAVVNSLKAVSATVAAGGAGYTNGDVLTVTGDTGTAATFTATVTAGIVTAVTPLTGGALTAVAANPHATTGGTGVGCTLNVLYGIGAVTVTPGQGYVTAPTAVFSTDALSATVAAGGAGYTNGATVTIAGDTGTAAAFVITAPSGNITGATLASGGTLTAVAANPHAITGGDGVGGTLDVAYRVGLGNGAALTLTLAAPVGNTTIPYTAATDGDFGRLSVYFNGARKTETTDYTLVNNAGNTYVVPTTGLAIGTQLNARLVVPLDILIEFVAPGLVLSAASIRYEQVLQTSAVVLLASLSASQTYYVAVAANGVTNFKLTSAAWTGLERYQLRIVGTVTLDGAGAISATTVFQYGYEALTEWYNARHQLNLDYWAGINEGGFINSGTHDNSGSNVTGMVAVKNRMAIFYEQQTQLWQVDPVPTSVAFIDSYAFGSRYEGVNFYNRPLIYTQKGFRAFDLQGLNFQSLEDVNIGEAIQQLGKFEVKSAVFWPWRGSYLAACTLTGTAAYAERAGLPRDSILWQSSIECFAYLGFSKESGISAWSILAVDDLTDVDAMIADDGKVYMLQGREIWYFDNELTAFTDGETGETQPRGVAAWHLVPLGGAIKSVRMLHMDVVKQGSARFNTSTMPWNAQNETRGPIVADTSVGDLRIPLRCTGRSASLRLITNDPNGVDLQSLTIEYMPLGR